MKKADLTGAVWRTSSHSSGNGQCVAVAVVEGVVAVRDSKDPCGSAVVVAAGGFSAFVRGVRDGGLDRRPNAR